MKVSKITPSVRATLTSEGISQDELTHMLDHSAITSVDGCNRRFNHWLFEVRDGVLKRMLSTGMEEIGRNRGFGFMVEDCVHCEGDGCKECGWRGEVKHWLSK